MEKEIVWFLKLFFVFQVWFQNRRMKHKRQTLSKDETDIKTPKSKSDSVGGEGKLCGCDSGGCDGCDLPPGAACPGQPLDQGPGSVKDEEEGVKVIFN